MMKKINNDKKNFLWNAIGLSMNAFNSLFFLIVVKWINGINQAGVFTYAFSLVNLFYVISNYYTRTYQIANYNNNKNFNQFLTSRIIFSAITIFLMVLFLIINKFSIFKSTVILLLLLFRIVESISDCLYGVVQDRGELYKAGISLFIKGVSGLIIFLIVDYLSSNLYISIISLFVVNLLFFILYDINNIKKYKIDKYKFDISNFKLILIEAFPIFIFTFLSIYLANMQKYILTYYVSNNIQTIFGILIMPATMLSLVGNYLIMPFINKLNLELKNKNISKFYNISYKILFSLILFGILAVVVSYIIGIPVLNIIYNVKLNKYKILLIIIIISSVLNAISMIISNLMIILNENKIQLIIYFIIAILGTITSLILIKNKFIIGAVYSYLIVYLGMCILYTIIFIKYKSRKTRELNAGGSL